MLSVNFEKAFQFYFYPLLKKVMRSEEKNIVKNRKKN